MIKELRMSLKAKYLDEIKGKLSAAASDRRLTPQEYDELLEKVKDECECRIDARAGDDIFDDDFDPTPHDTGPDGIDPDGDDDDDSG